MGEYWVQISADLTTIVQTDLVINLTKEVITSMMHILIWAALFLEFFLAIWMTMTNKKTNNAFSTNGTASTKTKKAVSQL